MRGLLKHLKSYILRGLLAIIPLALTAFAIKILYSTIDKRITAIVEQIIGFSFPGLGVLLLLATLYLLGLVVSNIVGKQMFGLVEKIANRIPLVKTTYNVGRQLSGTLSLPEEQVFRRAVLVEYLKPGMWTIGFVTGTIVERENDEKKLLKVFIPTPLNPISGAMVIVRESQTRDLGWSLEEALKAVISGGVVSPPKIGTAHGNRTKDEASSPVLENELPQVDEDYLFKGKQRRCRAIFDQCCLQSKNLTFLEATISQKELTARRLIR